MLLRDVLRARFFEPDFRLRVCTAGCSSVSGSVSGSVLAGTGTSTAYTSGVCCVPLGPATGGRATSGIRDVRVQFGGVDPDSTPVHGVDHLALPLRRRGFGELRLARAHIVTTRAFLATGAAATAMAMMVVELVGSREEIRVMSRD